MTKQLSLKPTSLDFAILGLVSHQALSGYGIRKLFETSALGNFSTSPGTIYPALKRMQQLDLVENRESKIDGKKKFFITQKGKQTLKKWLVQPLELSDIARRREEVLLRFAFMDVLQSRDQVTRFLESLRELLSTYVDQLEDYHKTEYSSMPLQGRLSFEHGIESYKATLSWCERALTEILKSN